MTTHHPAEGNHIDTYVSIPVHPTTRRTPVAIVLTLWLVFLVSLAGYIVVLWLWFGVRGVVVAAVFFPGPVLLCWDEVAARYEIWPWHTREPVTW